MLYGPDVGDDHCPVEIEPVEWSFLRNVICVVLVSGLGIAADHDFLRKEVQESAVP